MYISVLSKYLIRTYLKKLLLVSLVVAFALILSSVFDILHRIKGVNLPYTAFLQLTFLKVPYLILEVLPLIAMLTMFLLHYILGKNNELLMMTSSGVSIYQLLLPILLVNFVIGTIAITAINPFSTYALKKYEKIDATLTDRKLPYLVLSNLGIMIAEDYQNEHRIYVARSVLVHEKRMLDVSVFFTDANNNFDKRIEAKSADFGLNELILKNIAIFSDDAQMSTSPQYILPSRLAINNLVDGVTAPEHVNFWRLPDLIRHLSNAGFPTFKHQLYYYKILFKPVALVAYALYAMCFLSYSYRGKNVLNKIAVGILGGMFLYLVSQLTSNILSYKDFSIAASVLLPNLVLIMGSNFLLLHLRAD